MKNNYNTFEEKTSFKKIREMLLNHCKGSIGASYINNISFETDIEKIQNSLKLTHEVKNIISLGNSPILDEYFDLSEILYAARIEGSFITEEQLVFIKINYSTYYNFVSFLNKISVETFPMLSDLVSGFTYLDWINKRIDKIINNNGQIYDNASEELKNIRVELSKSEKKIEESIRRCLTQGIKSGILSSDTEIVIRNGLSVIPINSSKKRQIKGFIIDESLTGSTSYIQPVEAIETINKKKELELAEKREIIKILTKITDELRPYFEHINETTKFLGFLDFLFSKARLAIDLNCTIPNIENKPYISWKNAKHPLLMISLKKQGKNLIPADINIGNESNIIILSGPNAGGKSVTLKTVALLQYMLQCGLLIPIDENCTTGIFDFIYIDIGDQQSIENDLSTYSSHLLHIKQLLEIADENTLFLIDEFGSGTDPQSGGAIAEAVLEELIKKNAKGLVTTHYGNLKKLASQNEGFSNAAMLFDNNKMKPLYIFKKGNPGSSFAFEIAREINLPKHLIDFASEKIGDTYLNFEKELQNLETEKHLLELKKKQLKEADNMLNSLVNKYQNELDNWNLKKKTILNKAYNKAEDIIKDANKIIENTVREIKETQAEKEEIQKIRNSVEEFKKNLETEKQEINKAEIKVENNNAKSEDIKIDKNAKISIGSKVRIKGHTEVGDVINISNKEAIVEFDNIKLTISLKNLEVVVNTGKTRNNIYNSYGFQNAINNINLQTANFSLTLDLRGKTVEESLLLTKKHLEEANMLYVKEVRILHGKGNGILRKAVRDMLPSLNFVEDFYEAPEELGGAGITIVSLK